MVRFVLLSCLFLITCCGLGDDHRQLNQIEQYIQDKPDSALIQLRKFAISSFKRPETKAYYALLYSMALDKNYIDITSDSLIAPAITYYNHRDQYHRFLSLYYQGRVFENAGSYARAMDSYLNAENSLCSKVPDSYKVRLYTGKARVYLKQFALDRALEETLKAKTISSTLDNPLFYLRNTLDAASLYTTKGDYEKAGSAINDVELWVEGHDVSLPVDYYESRLRIALADTTETNETILHKCLSYKQYCESCGKTPNYLLIAKTMSMTGKVEEAGQAMSMYELPTSCSEFDKVEYYAEVSALSQAVGDYKRALEAELKYQGVVEKINLDVFNNDVRFLEERYNDTIQAEKNLRQRIGLSILAALLLAGLTATVLLFHRRESRYKDSIAEARAEYSFISDMMSNIRPESEQFQNMLFHRMVALRPYLSSDSLAPFVFTSRKDIEHIDEGRKDMLRSIGMLYALSYPSFISALVGYGLTAEEAGLCSLYVAGFSSKEMTDYLHSGSIVHINGNIRKKIGSLVDGYKLPTFLKQLFNDTESKKS